ncbi:MAG: sigma-70 family RNA polymerase sigma factor [Pseudoxanthomonas sp.]|nr:sigma-70 family RNA polymerase sigma factor [Pseudoxanthomonas sp.]
MSAGFRDDLDADTLAALRRGCPAALARVYDAWAGVVYALALRVLGQREAAEDLVQDLFLRLPRASGRFRGEAPFGAWLRRLAANATVDRLRERRRLLPLDEARAELAGRAGDDAARVDADVLLRRLSPSARLVLLLHAVEGWTHEELAVLFGQSPSWSKSLLSRALRRLRSGLPATEVADGLADSH